MFRATPGVVVRGSGYGGYALRMTRGMCQPHYIIDGQYQPGFELDLIPPADIEGIELYRGSSETPPQFNLMNAMCGVVVVWTRDPEAG
jgi:outer membrane receptor protein involved in Fe transport